ncbi:hypothetical protein GCM10009117_15270 [Gangjinia marincola]|uniref:Uncharacterized protein n=1 Tax=Gangjinia marincola TaxID=578463 RepID=A0ABP3XT13_9FLAO
MKKITFVFALLLSGVIGIAQTTLTQNSGDVTGTNSVGCPGGDNDWARNFVLADYGISADFNLTSGSVGVQSTDGSGTSITVNVYATDAGFPGTFDTANLLGSQVVAVDAATVETTVDFVFDTPILIPGGTQSIAVAVVVPLGNNFFIGGTPTETTESFLRSTNCSVADYVTPSSIGFPDANPLIEVSGSLAGPNTTCGFAATATLGINSAVGMDNTDGGAVDGCYSSGTDALWYRFTAVETGELTITSDVNGQTQDTRLSVYDSCTDLNCLGNDDDGGTGLTSSLILSLEAGQSIFLEWDDRWSEADFDFELSFNVTCANPINLIVASEAGISAELEWDDAADAVNGYVVEVYNSGDDPDIDTPVFTENVPTGTSNVTVTGLSEVSSYDAYVSSDCDAGGISGATVVSFETGFLPPACGGNFYDTGGPGSDYQNSENLTTIITPDNAGDLVTVTFTAFNIENGFDELIVYDGPDAGSPQLDILTGDLSANVPFSFTSSDASGSLTFVFTSDGSVTRAGWEADVTCAVAPARVQVIHNSPDPDVQTVDVYLNDDLLLDDFQFRTATSFIDAPAGVPLTIDVAPGDSDDSGDSIFELTATLDSGETYIVVADGVVTDPDAGEEFSLEVYAGARETGTDPANTDVLVHHGSPDAPTVDIVETSIPAGIIVDDISYTDFQGYLSLPTADYTVSVTTADGATEVAAFSAPLALLGQEGEAITVLASGFLAPDAGEPEFGLWVALPIGGNLIALPTAPLSINGNTIEGVSVYPVPANDVLNIRAQNNVEQIEIFNLLGQRVFMQKAGSTTASFDISELSAGNYILRATIGGQIGNYQIIKR